MKILLTGADGFLGNNLVRELILRGYEVRALIQPGRNSSTLEELNIELFNGDILNSSDVLKATKGCNAIIHTAADTTTWPSRTGLIRKVNVEGTGNIIAAALNRGIEKYVHVGSANSFGFGSKDNPGDETMPYRASKYRLEYFDSKHEAHKLVMNEISGNGLRAVVVNPTFMIGPFDSKPGFGTVILAIYNGRMPGCAVGGRNYIHVSDVAVGTINALERGRIGECYLLGNQNLSYREIFNMIAEVVGVKPPKVTFPPFVTKLYGILGSLYGTITQKSSIVSFALARIACDEHYYTAQKAVRELELPQTPIETAIEDAFIWFKQNGYLEMKF